jgi:hypothetical protein
MHGPSAPLNVRDLCDAIRIKLRESARFDHPSKQPLQGALEEILSASNLTWKYLNGGTHEEEDRDEFDRAEVDLVVTRLERIDALELRAAPQAPGRSDPPLCEPHRDDGSTAAPKHGSTASTGQRQQAFDSEEKTAR